MRLLFTSDLHGNEIVYNKLFDFIKKNKIKKAILGGDLCPHKHNKVQLGVRVQSDFLVRLINRIKEADAEFFVMLGNDDFRINASLLEEADKDGILKYIHNRANRIGKYTIVGYSFVSEMPFLLKDWEKMDDKFSVPLTNPNYEVRTTAKEEGTIEEDLKKLKRLSNPKNTIYAMHAPPNSTMLDVISSGEHAGSKSVRRFIEKEKPLLTLHGHIHESFEMTGKFMDRLNGTICVNAGSSHIASKLNLAVFEMEDLNNIEHFII